MADVPVYSSPMAKQGLQPNSRGSDAAIMEGNAWNRAFHELGDVAEKVGNQIEEIFQIYTTFQNLFNRE